MKVAFYTLGCKVNQYESQAMSEVLKNNGYEIVNIKDKSDIYIINSCTVTSQSNQKTRQTVRRFKRENPECIVVLTGCMPQAFPEEAELLNEADIIIGNKTNSSLLNLLDEYSKFGKRIVNISDHKKGDSFSNIPITSFDERTRAYLKIQDGCDRFCSYCIIPFSRGRVRSKSLEDIKTEVEKLAENGYKEIVLVGINLSSYGKDTGATFPDAVSTVCNIDGIERVRLGSLEPDHLTDEVIESLAKEKKLCPQFHISLQSGCNKILRLMNRHYNCQEYSDIVHKLRSSFDDCTITTDIMVGFAGESEEDFLETLEYMKHIKFEKVHVFPYSIRSGTKAEKMEGHLDNGEKNRRAKIMIDLADKIRKEYFESIIGQTKEVLVEKRMKNGYYSGYTTNYTPVVIKTESDISGKLVMVKLIEIYEDSVISELVE